MLAAPRGPDGEGITRETNVKSIERRDLWKRYQVAMVDEADLIILFQPIYQVGVRKSIKDFPLTAAGWCVGSPSYLAPERLLGRAYDARADVYAVAVTLYEMLAGARPFPVTRTVRRSVRLSTRKNSRKVQRFTFCASATRRFNRVAAGAKSVLRSSTGSRPMCRSSSPASRPHQARWRHTSSAKALVFGMPGAAIQIDAARYILSPEGIIELLEGLVKSR